MRRITLVLVTIVVVFASVPVQAQPRVVADAGQYSLPAMALLIAAVHRDGDGVIDLLQSLSVAWATTWSLRSSLTQSDPTEADIPFHPRTRLWHSPVLLTSGSATDGNGVRQLLWLPQW